MFALLARDVEMTREVTGLSLQCGSMELLAFGCDGALEDTLLRGESVVINLDGIKVRSCFRGGYWDPCQVVS